MAKVGRNARCPCGSGKKYKHCHGNLETPSPSVASGGAKGGIRQIIFPPKVEKAIAQHLAQRQREQQALEAKHGKGRPVISLEHHGYRLVAVGNELHWAKAEKTKFFPDFLTNYLKAQLVVDWGNAELKKPLEARHQILKWYDSLCRYQRTIKPEADGTYRAEPSGAMLAWNRLAYDLYLIKHNAKLQARILERLKHPDQFQGARFELVVAATMVVAGFKIDYEDESDTSRKHAEFIAKHRSGLVVAVEAKSRHRDGVLGFKSPKAQVTDKVQVENILRGALAKEPSAPFFIFVEVNLPPPTSPIGEGNPWFKEMAETVDRLVGEWDPGTFPATAIFFGNDPSHYVLDQKVEAQQYWCYAIPIEKPRHPRPDARVIDEVGGSTMQRCMIPNEFPPEEKPLEL
jgi:hypothetical protein